MLLESKMGRRPISVVRTAEVVLLAVVVEGTGVVVKPRHSGLMCSFVRRLQLMKRLDTPEVEMA